MIKAPLLIRLLKQRLAHNDTWLAQDQVAMVGSFQMSYGPGVTRDMVEGYRLATVEENEFLYVILEKAKWGCFKQE